MTNQEKRIYLERYKWTAIEVKRLKEQINQLKLTALPGGISYDGMPHGSGGKFDLSDYAVKLDNLIQSYRKTLQRKMKDLHDITEALDQMEKRIRQQDEKKLRLVTLLRLKYIYGHDWDQIGDEMGYSEDYVKRHLHSIALTEFEIPEKHKTCS